MYRFIILFIPLLGFGNLCPAQVMDSRTIEDSSYYYYLNADHTRQIRLCNLALQQGMDYFFLRCRLGYAYFSKGNYAMALHHYNDANNKNPGDKNVAEFIYYCTQNLGLENEEHYMGNHLDSVVTRKKKYESFQLISDVFSEGGMKFVAGTDSLQQLNYYMFGLKHRLSSSLSWTQSYSHIGQKYYWGNLEQFQYYSMLNLKTSITTDLAASVHYIFSKSTGTDVNNPVTKETLLLGIWGHKIWKRWELRPGFTFVNSGGGHWFQADLGAQFYLQGNSSIIIGVNPGIQFSDSGLKPMPKISVAGKIGPRIWLQGEYFFANTSMFQELSGSIVNNSPDLTLDRLGAMLTYLYKKKSYLYLVIQHERKDENNYHIKYGYLTAIAGIKFNL